MFQQSRTEQPDRAFPFLRRLDLIIAEDLHLRLRIGLGEDRYEHVEQDEAHQQHEENEEQRAGHRVGALQIEVLKVAEQGAEERHHRAASRSLVSSLPSHFLDRISPISFPFFPVFCAFSPSRRGGSNEPQAGTQGQQTASKGTKR
eukprot:COSAG04_NODE_9449_length_863_cov_1.208115_2_plen_145_part_01